MSDIEINVIAMEYAVRISLPGTSSGEVLAIAEAFAKFIRK